MNIALPPDGFTIIVSPAVQALVDSRAGDERFERLWNDILERLRYTAHLEGTSINRPGPGYRLWVSAAAGDLKLPRVKLVYRPLGNKVHIAIAAID